MGSRRGRSTLEMVVLVVGALIASVFVARLLGFVFRLVYSLVWYAVAFAVAFAVLSWVWSKISGGRKDRSAHDSSLMERDMERDASGRRRY